jgi:hypothetical protein
MRNGINGYIWKKFQNIFVDSMAAWTVLGTYIASIRRSRKLRGSGVK